jgi:hypothetical protein
MRLSLAPLACALALLAAEAHAQGASEQAKALVGAYELSNAERDKTCNVTLKTDPARGGFKLEFEKPCGDTIAATRDIEAWTFVNDALRFVDARGRVLFDFTEVESGMFEAERRGEGLYFLQNKAAAADLPPAKTADQMAGEWTLSRGAGRPICTMALQNAASNEEGLRLQVRPGCDPFVTRFNPGSWSMDQGQLVLIGRSGDTWRFEQDDENANLWRRLPESAERVTMTKK